MNRSERAQLGEQTIAILARGGYVAADGSWVEIGAAQHDAVAATRLVRPEEWDCILSAGRDRGGPGAAATIELTGETTLAATRRLVVEEGRSDVAGLNFASAKNPGGGFRSGSQAQEESLARSSGLIAALEAAPKYYAANRKHPDTLYTDHAILSPRVPVFRDDDGALLASPYLATFITMPAANVGAIRAGSPLRGQVEAVMRRRMNCVLALAAGTGLRSIVLGAWGCGVFRNDPDMIASLWASCLSGQNSWRSCFDRIVFAVFDSSESGAVRGAFERHVLAMVPVNAGGRT